MYGSHNTKLAKASATLAILPLLFTPLTTATNIERRHIQLVTPKPFDWDEYGPTNPLNPDGSDYPCKVPQGESFKVNGSPTEMAIGEDQVVSFAGFAVHGGGSCQFALTEGLAPTKESAWKVIHSIEGGCPKANVAGNLDPGQSPDNYTFSIPDDFAAGEYTFAWTWVNRIAGQPEFYMNCAPIKVTAAAGSTRKVKERRSKYDRRDTSYPDLFLANIGDASNGCETSEALYQQIAIAYPHPGNSVSYPNGQANLFKQPCDGNSRNSGAAGASAESSNSVPSPSAVATTTTSVAVSTAAAAPTTVSTSTSIDSPISSVPAATSNSVVSNTAPTSTASSSGTGSLNSPCTDGHLLCVSGTQFSTCTAGKWTTPQDLASNARCKMEGESVGLDIYNTD